MIEEGKKAPSFTLPTDKEEKFTLSKMSGKTVVIFFYPKDDTSGCTKEAIAFSDLKEKFSKLGAEIFGISPDSVEKHQKFIKKHDLTVTLLADEDKKACEKYGVWVEKKMYGKTYMGVERSTFVIDPKGKVARIWRKVKVPGHAEEVLEFVQNLG